MNLAWSQRISENLKICGVSFRFSFGTHLKEVIMHCTSCKGSNLEPQELEPGLIAAVCQQCEGALVSLMNYRFWVDRYGSHADKVEVLAEEIPDEQPGVRACPKCTRLMTKYQMGAESD